MGVHPNVTADREPKQGPFVGRRVLVWFHHDTTRGLLGTILREDQEEPYVTVIGLDDDDRVVLATECQFSIVE